MKRPVVLCAALLCLAGCGTSPSVEQVRWEIQRRFPEARFTLEEHIRLGRLSLGLIRGLVRMVPGKVEGQEILTAIHHVDLATYRVRALDLDRLQGETRFERQLAEAGWHMTVRTREEDSRAWIFTRGEEDALNSLFVVTLEAGELTLVSVDGRLDRALAEAIALNPKEAVRKVKAGGEGKPAEPSGVL
ncbi:MAG TPA: DUF4252 domain-containing protein [Thermoanaerobaculia bacterium]|jgi:hypothetical protein